MKLRTGTIVPGTETLAGDGINSPMRAAVRVDGELHAAIVKRLNNRELLAECFCAMLLTAWGLPVPEPVLIIDNEGHAFASLDAGYPSLKKRIGLLNSGNNEALRTLLVKVGATIACAFPDAGRALAIDELIGNDDRNLGNILWDGEHHAYIDHERTRP